MKPLAIATLIALGGCATAQDPNYTAYLASAQAQQQKPVFSLSCPATGCIVADLKVYNQSANAIQAPVPQKSFGEGYGQRSYKWLESAYSGMRLIHLPS